MATAVWLGCGASPPKPAHPDTSAEPSEPSSAGDIAGSNLAAGTKSAEPAETAAPPPPPPPPKFSEGDCGQCLIEKTCAKQVKACTANADCKDALDAINACPADKKEMKDCADKVTPPKAAAAKKLVAAYSTCLGKADKDAACKDKCK